ncbi:MAG: helicase RepA family protein [Trichloromonadaceae bacterium]
MTGMEHIKPLDLDKCFSTEPPPLDFVLPGLLAGTVGALVAAGGTSKSAWALQAATTIAGGPDLLGLGNIDRAWRLSTGRVAYVAAEDPELLLHHRMHGLGAMLSAVQRAEIRERLEILPVNGLLLDVIESELWKNWLYKIAEGARLLVIDTLRRVHQLDENESGAMARLVGLLESICHQTGATVLFIHHANKAGATTGEAAATRGSSVLTDNARLQLNLVTMQEAEAKALEVDLENRRQFVRLIYAKTNYCAPYPDRWYRRMEGGRLEPAHLVQDAAKKKGGRNGYGG